MPFISAIVPVYNSEDTIEKCIRSLLCQAFKDFEICIIDGASTDRTIERINRFRSQFENIRILSERDRGTYDAMNKGIDLARGEWLYFLGSDDEVYDPEVFTDIVSVARTTKGGIIYGNVRIDGDTSWAKDGQIYDGEFSDEKILTRNICHQAIFYRKTMFAKLGKYDLRYPVCADWELNLRFFPCANPYYLDRIIANFQAGGLSGTNNEDTNNPYAEDRSEFLKKKFGFEYKFRRLMRTIGLR